MDCQARGEKSPNYPPPSGAVPAIAGPFLPGLLQGREYNEQSGMAQGAPCARTRGVLAQPILPFLPDAAGGERDFATALLFP